MTTTTESHSRASPADRKQPSGSGRSRWRRSIDWLEHRGIIAGLSLGALAGLADVTWTGLRRVWAGRLVFVPEHFWWAAPWLNGVLAAAITVALLALLPRRLAAHRDRIRLGVPVAIAAAGVLMFVPRLHLAAVALLAAGVGIRGGMWLARRAVIVDRALAVSVPVLLVLAPLLTTAAFRLPAGGAGGGAAGGAAGLPNIVIIVLDTVRAIELSLYGSREQTSPVIDRVGAQGVVFERASSTAPWTLPSHASLFTGRWAHELSASLLTPLDDSVPTLAEVLAEHGYATAGFSANVEYASAETGVARGFMHYADHRWSLRGTLRLTRLSRVLANTASRLDPRPADQPGRVDAAVINRRFLKWFERRQDAPFFAFLNYYDAHAPYYPPQPQWTRFVGDAPRRPLNNPHSDADRPDRVELQRRAYAGAINYIDEHIGMVLDSLRASGELDNTILIITSDHGEEFSEHGVLGHGNTLYLPSVHVPLIMRWPDHIPAGCRIAEPVSIRDVPATVMDLIGSAPRFPGRSLPALWTATDDSLPSKSSVFTHTQRAINQPAHLPASRGPLLGVELWPYRLLIETDPFAWSLFDRQADPAELADLAGQPAMQPVVAQLLDSLRAAGATLNDLPQQLDRTVRSSAESDALAQQVCGEPDT